MAGPGQSQDGCDRAGGGGVSHVCELCGQLCYCDIEDVEMEEAPEDCSHECHEESDEDEDC